MPDATVSLPARSRPDLLSTGRFVVAGRAPHPNSSFSGAPISRRKLPASGSRRASGMSAILCASQLVGRFCGLGSLSQLIPSRAGRFFGTIASCGPNWP